MKRRFRVPAFVGSALLFLGCGAAIGGDATDGWTAQELSVIKGLHIGQLECVQQDPSNGVEARLDAAALGKKLFFDERLSANGKVACATCHLPERQFQDDQPLGRGVATSGRRTMPLAESGRGPWLFWDGRKDSLWSQALGPMEDANEHGSNRVALVRLVQQFHRADYEAVFPALPDLRQWPLAASPKGNPTERTAWAAMTPAQQEAASRVFANMGKAIAAYVKRLHYGPSKLDRYIRGVADGAPGASGLLSDSEKRGLRLFIGKGQCVTCHAGPLFTDQHFHNTGVPPRLGTSADRGRAAAIDVVRQDEFNCLGRFSDARRGQCGELEFIAADDPHMVGAFKTPGLRGVADRAPYMHGGQIASLQDVVRHYAKAPRAAVGRNERQPLALSEVDINDLANFLTTLTSPIEERQSQ